MATIRPLSDATQQRNEAVFGCTARRCGLAPRFDSKLAPDKLARVCTLAVYRRISPRYPLIVVANRDEFLGRQSAPPALWSDPPHVMAGRDLVAGGTWLGCRTDGSGRIVGLLNRRPAVDKPAAGPGERSRGLLCIETLAAKTIDDAVDALDEIEAARYGGFNLFIADLDQALVLDNGHGVRRVSLDTGLSVLTNLDLNDPRCPRLAGATKRFGALVPMLERGGEAEEALPRLAAVLSSHEAGDIPESANDPALEKLGGALPFSKICVHVGDYGTRSSSAIFVDDDGGVRYFHAEGSPCTTAFHEVMAVPASPV